jgi:hypothetical protein
MTVVQVLGHIDFAEPTNDPRTINLSIPDPTYERTIWSASVSSILHILKGHVFRLTR